ncbi:hypothetical protein [Rubripirellula reticaptiva]|nr:hypothetical protein [Rubripirellula reticaptiva]
MCPSNVLYKLPRLIPVASVIPEIVLAAYLYAQKTSIARSTTSASSNDLSQGMPAYQVNYLDSSAKPTLF